MILKGKLSIVTGAAQGIGRKIAEKLAENGSDLMICDVNQEALKEACSAGFKIREFPAPRAGAIFQATFSTG